MSVEINVISQKYYKQWINDSAFSSDLTNYVANLAALVMQKIKLITVVDVHTATKSGVAAANSPANLSWTFTPIAPSTSNTVTITNNGQIDWVNERFFVGDTVTFYGTSLSIGNFSSVDGTVTAVTPSVITIYYSLAQSYPNDIINAMLVNKTPLTSLIYNYGLIENTDNFNTNSLVTSENQGYYSTSEIGTGSPRATTFVAMEGLGIPNSWDSGSCQARYVSGTETQRFEIEHIFIIPFYRVGDLTDLENDVPPDYLLGNASLKYVFDVDLRTVLSNPNTSKYKKIENILGSVGFFNEVFNGFDSNYQINSISYVDQSTSLSADGLLISGTTEVTIEVEKISGNFGTDNVGVYFSYLPQLQAEVENTITDFETNFMYDNIFAVIGAGATSGSGVLDNCEATASTNILTITFETSLSIAQQLRLANGGNYLIGIEVGDSTISAGSSDAVMLKVIDEFDFSADIPDLFKEFEFELYPHTQPFASGGFTDGRAWNEDGFGIKGNFTIDLTKDAFINSMKGLLVAHKSSANSYFVMDGFDYVLGTGIVTVAGQDYQILDMVADRNYRLASGSEKNGVSVTLDQASIVSPYQDAAYDFTFAQKIRWEDWIKNYDVDNIFYDSSKLNNNLNYKSSNYGSSFGYKLKIMFQLNIYGTSVLGVSGNTIYNFLSNNISVYDYDDDEFSPSPRFTQVIETFTADGLTNLGGEILVGDDTLMRITWTHTTGIMADITDFWGIHRIEITGETGQQIDELSTTETNELTNNLLKGITTDYLDMSLVLGEIVTECLIDGSKIQNGVNYNLSGRIESPDRPKGSFTARTSEDLEYRTSEDLEIRFIEN